MRIGWNVFMVIVLIGCGGSKNEGKVDSSVLVSDMAVQVGVYRGALGATCKADSDCGEGVKPTCFVENVFNDSDSRKAPGGYCSSSCTKNSECSAVGDCVTFDGQSTGWCLARCNAQSDCRSGYACFTSGGYCYPSGGLNCDPTAAGAACNDAPTSNPGACVRRAFGTGDVGVCTDGCTVGVGTCPATNGEARQCMVFDDRANTDPTTGAPYGDQLNGTICYSTYSTNADGAECLYGSYHYVSACVDGDACWLKGTHSGDNLCHKLCTGVAGGPACPTGQSCQDVFGLLASASPVGLCH